jgi:4,5-DOPA dioxygenase extradiol
MNLNELNNKRELKNDLSKMPVLFLGHGSPMNAIEDNEFSKGWQAIGNSLPKPEYILCISAHWETRGTYITATENPPTIHDFGGFPEELFRVQYPAQGSPELAMKTKNIVAKTEIEPDEKRGLDHGCWSVLKNMFPNADVPVVQLSLDYGKNLQYHYELAKELSPLRKEGVLIIGSGNMVHNLGIIDWRNPDGGYEWAEEANLKLKNLILENEHEQLINYKTLGKAVELAVPTTEHYLPLIYILALKEKTENISFFNDKTVLGSISMTSVLIN